MTIVALLEHDQSATNRCDVLEDMTEEVLLLERTIE